MSESTRDIFGSILFLSGSIYLFSMQIHPYTGSDVVTSQYLTASFGFAFSLVAAGVAARSSSLPRVIKWVCLTLGALFIGWLAMYFNDPVKTPIIAASMLGYWVRYP